VQVDPQNSNHVFACSWGYGLLEFNEGKLVKVHDQTNSTLYPVEGFSSGYVRIGCATFDKENNLWIGNSAVQNPISVKKADGTWFNFPKAEYGSIIGRESLIDDIIVTQNGYKWGVLRNGGGLFAFSEGENIDNEGDDKFKAFSVNDKDGHAITSRVYSIAEDLEGVIWLGTEKGIVVYYNPNNVFSKEEGAFFGQQVRVHAEGNDSILQDLLGTEKVNAIAVDGANRKWFATENAGVFLMSEDGTEQIYHFNIANSPLLSNNVLCIAINHTTGEVFFGTEKGIISFMGTATKGDTFFREVLVFPNPVKPNFDGVITIKGLITNVNVKISDIAGHLVYETTSHGGQATWDGKGFDGARVQTGVYLVFCTNEDGSKTYITKILFIN